MRKQLQSSRPSLDELRLREMQRSDLRDVVKLEHASFREPWRPGDFRRHLDQYHDYDCEVIVDLCDQVVGYVITTRPGMTMEIVNLAVAPAWRRIGVASWTIAALQAAARALDGDQLLAFVRESNVAAQLLLRSQGFVCTLIRRDFYLLCAESAYVFEWWPEQRRPFRVRFMPHNRISQYLPSAPAHDGTV